LPRERSAQTGFDQKMSESVTSDSHPAHMPSGKLFAAAFADIAFRRNFQLHT
jgi:hypothetical protein